MNTFTPEEIAEYVDQAENRCPLGTVVIDAIGIITYLQSREKVLLDALKSAVKIADEASDEWDKAPSGMRTGKILIALSGHCPGYRKDIDAIHAILKDAQS